MAETEEVQHVTEDGDEKSAAGKTPAEEAGLFPGCNKTTVVCKPEEPSPLWGAETGAAQCSPCGCSKTEHSSRTVPTTPFSISLLGALSCLGFPGSGRDISAGLTQSAADFSNFSIAEHRSREMKQEKMKQERGLELDGPI